MLIFWNAMMLKRIFLTCIIFVFAAVAGDGLNQVMLKVKPSQAFFHSFPEGSLASHALV
jgi:hypothetical protein